MIALCYCYIHKSVCFQYSQQISAWEDGISIGSLSEAEDKIIKASEQLKASLWFPLECKLYLTLSKRRTMLTFLCTS